MRSRISRHLASFDLTTPALAPPAQAVAFRAVAPQKAPVLPPEFNWRDYITMLVTIAAEIEHSLMVEYLFAAYSMGGPQVPPLLQGDVRRWQEIVLGIAKEEMGHFVTVQNLLMALGAPLHFDREDYPWGTDFYPFGFTLRRFSLGSLATYICAESPPNWTGQEADNIKALATVEAGQPVNRVGALYERLATILARREWIPDEAFQAGTLSYQASWDEWGRGYTRGERGEESGNVRGALAPELLVLQVSSRDSALDALTQIGEQGEALNALPGTGTPDDDAGESSHFRRFLTIYREITNDPPLTDDDSDRLARPVAENPVTSHDLDKEQIVSLLEAAGPDARERPSHVITNPEALAWAHLFNLRYRMLLVDAQHAYGLAQLGTLQGSTTARGALVNRTFAEMYNLRVIAGLLVDLPLDPDSGTGLHAGPPFEMPYSLVLPPNERDRWLLQRDLLEASCLAIQATRAESDRGRDYLVALEESDSLALGQVATILRSH